MGGNVQKKNLLDMESSVTNTDQYSPIKDSLLRTLDVPSYEPAVYAWGVMRHGKTTQKDNEGTSYHILERDPPKGTKVTLSEEEKDAQKSTIYATLKQIASLGYKTIRIYAPHDTKRNDETLALLYTYAKELGISLIEDTEFSAVADFAARKKIDQRVVQELLEKGYMTDREYQYLHLRQNGEKAIFGNAKYLKDIISPSTLAKVEYEDNALYKKACEQVEEVYGDTINNAGQGFDALSHYIAKRNERDEFNLVVGYRTTLQAFDKKFIEIDPKNIDLHYTSNPSEAHIGSLNKSGGVSKQMKDLRMPDMETYQEDIEYFQEFIPGVSTTNTLVHNQNAVNAFLIHMQADLQEYIEAGNKDIKPWLDGAKADPLFQKTILEKLEEYILREHSSQAVFCAQVLINILWPAAKEEDETDEDSDTDDEEIEGMKNPDALIDMLKRIKHTHSWLKDYIIDIILTIGVENPQLLIGLGAVLGYEALGLYNNRKNNEKLPMKTLLDDRQGMYDWTYGERVYILGRNHRIIVTYDRTTQTYRVFDSHFLDIDVFVQTMHIGIDNIKKMYRIGKEKKNKYNTFLQDLIKYVLFPLYDMMGKDVTYDTRDVIKKKGLFKEPYFIDNLVKYMEQEPLLKKRYTTYRDQYPDILPLK